MNIRKFLPKKAKQGERRPEDRYFRLTVWSFVGLSLVLALAALTAFLLTLRGPEQTQVPDISGEELVDAIISLQERGLYPLVQVRYHSDPTLRGRIISQEPEPGAIVRAGRRISVVVSQGAVIEEIANYVGRTIQDVQNDLQSLGVGGQGVLSIDAVSYVFDEQPAGTVIAQDPPAGTEIASSTALDLVVSRGPDVQRISLPTFLGLDWTDAVQVLARDNVPFIFSTEQQPTIGQEGVVVAQAPEPGTEVELGTPVRLTIRSVRPSNDELQFGIFDRTLPEYAVVVDLSAVVVSPDGESQTLFSMVHPGGRVAFPYVLPVGSTIILYRFDTEVIRYIVRSESAD